LVTEFGVRRENLLLIVIPIEYDPVTPAIRVRA
jgi:hypothetical protein